MTTVELICTRFGLGAPTTDLVGVAGGNSHRLYRLGTDGGDWAIKLLTRVDEPWWLEDFTRSAELETAAAAAGVRVPQPVAPSDPVGLLIAEMELDGRPESVRVSRWVEGSSVTAPVSRDALRWLGSTLATVARLLPVQNSVSDTYVRYPLEEWQEWTEQAETARLDLGAALRASLPVLTRANELLDDALHSETDLAVLHNDTSPYNVLGSSDGLWLLDWDSAGPDVPWFDLLASTWHFAGFPARPVQPADVRAAIGAYAEAGGAIGATDETAFVGLVHKTTRSLAYFTWRALGHRRVTPEEQVASEGVALNCLAELRAVTANLHNWAPLLQQPELISPPPAPRPLNSTSPKQRRSA